MNEYYIVTFQNTHEAMKAERETIKNQINVVVIPTPTFITKSCGISLKVETENIEAIINLTRAENIKVKAIFIKDGETVKTINIY